MQRRLNRAIVPSLVALLAVLVTAPAFATSPHAATGGSPETGQVVVGFSATVSPAQLDKTVKKSGARVVRTIDSGHLAVVDPRPGLSADRVIERLEGESGVRYAEPVHRVQALYTPDDPSYTLQWGLARIGAPRAWDVQRGSSSVRVAVIDSGVDYTHPDLAGRLDAANGYDFVDYDTYAQDGYGHGTHVAGIIAADTDNAVAVAGLAGGCLVIPLRVLDGSGSGTDVGVAQAIRWAADHGADIINLSLGSPEASTVMQEACDYAIAADCVLVAAAGNSAGQAAWAPGQIQHPAAYAPVVAVGAVDVADARASFSEWGSALDLVGPGVGIVSLYPVDRGTQVTISGTSMATAHVSGVAALLRSQNAGWSAAETIARLVASAEDLGAAGRDDQFGSGLVRADRALGVTSPPPVVAPTNGGTTTVPDDDVDVDGGTISNTGDDGDTGTGAGTVSASGGTAGASVAQGSGSEEDTGDVAAEDPVAGAIAGGTGASAGGSKPSAAPGATTQQPGEPTRRLIDLFTIALVAVVTFAGVGLWRARAKASANP